MKDDRNGDYSFQSIVNIFTKQHISSGTEGKVYLAHFFRPRYLYDDIIIKEIDIKTKQQQRGLKIQTPDALYKLFFTDTILRIPYMHEIITQTLTNQLVFQSICPHFALNLYWDLEINKHASIYSYNDYANAKDFDTWARQKHSYDVWCNGLFQIMFGLLALRKYFNMVHSDFHTGNILVQKVAPGGYWTYIVNGTKYHLPNLGYVFLIHDFGFAWIPGKLVPIKWHYNQTLKYITKNGLEFYDISMFLYWLQEIKEYKLPKRFNNLLTNSFANEETRFIMSSRYFKLHPSKLPKNYPKINVDYHGLQTTLADKLYQIFYPIYGFQLLPQEPIETFSLDLVFNKRKLPAPLQKLVI